MLVNSISMQMHLRKSESIDNNCSLILPQPAILSTMLRYVAAPICLCIARRSLVLARKLVLNKQLPQRSAFLVLGRMAEDKIHFVHLARSRGGTAFEQPIACAIFRLFCYAVALEQARCTHITKQPATYAVGCSKAERTRFIPPISTNAYA